MLNEGKVESNANNFKDEACCCYALGNLHFVSPELHHWAVTGRGYHCFWISPYSCAVPALEKCDLGSYTRVSAYKERS